MPLNSLVSPEHERIAHILMNKENRSNHMKITYSDSCKIFSHSKDILEASNWCLREPKEHAKRSRWLGGQLVQQARSEGQMCMISKQSCTRTTRTSTCNSVLIVACCTNCPSNHLDLFACSLGSLRHQFDVSRVSFKRLDGLQLPKYVIFIWFDLFSLFIYIWAILSCSGDTKLFDGIYDMVQLHWYSI